MTKIENILKALAFIVQHCSNPPILIKGNKLYCDYSVDYGESDVEILGSLGFYANQHGPHSDMFCCDVNAM